MVSITEKKRYRGVYIVNGKEVNTNLPIWGKNLENFEYKSLKAFIKAINKSK